jgi:hypothetical protein
MHGWFPRHARPVALATLLALAPASAGCFGSFRLTRGIYGFNKDVSSNKFLRWLVFLGLVIIPVYEIGGLGDVLIFNTLDFWVEGGAVAQADAAPEQRVVQLEDDQQLVLTRDPAGMRGQLRAHGIVRAEWFIERTAEGLALRDADGTPIAIVRDGPDGKAQLLDPNGQPLALAGATDADPASYLARP